jgi:hypothetical protein
VINRRSLACDSCATRIITRTAIGLGNTQVLAFACPKCNVGIVFRMSLDQDAPSFQYEDKPENAHWVDTEDGATFEATFDVDYLVPREDVVYPCVPGAFRLSPYMRAHGRFQSFQQFAAHESARRQWLNARRPVVGRLCVHFERKNWKLFSKELVSLDSEARSDTQVKRFDYLSSAAREAIDLLTFRHSKITSVIDQRLALAKSISSELIHSLYEALHRARRLAEWWKQMQAVRFAYFDAYPNYHPVLQPLYWKDRSDVVTGYVVSNKGFAVLKELYISAFETMARLSTIAVAVEAIIFHAKLELPTKKSSLDIFAFEALSTANKRDHLLKYPTAEVFGDFLETRVRNGIGHNSARYDPVDDVVALVSSKDDQLVEARIPYTEFCRKVVSMASRLFAVETYLIDAIRSVGGQLEP